MTSTLLHVRKNTPRRTNMFLKQIYVQSIEKQKQKQHYNLANQPNLSPDPNHTIKASISSLFAECIKQSLCTKAKNL
jgi:hypothetical protein